MTFEEAAVKFRGCADYANCSVTKPRKLLLSSSLLETASDVNALWPLLSSDRS